jgi:formylglycine-generating enzyme required for sulfatase activity
MTNSKWMTVVLIPCVAVAAMACDASPQHEPLATAHSAAAPVLGTTQSFAVLAGTTVTNTGDTVISGDLGVSPGSAVTGFPPGLVMGGTTHAGDAAALQAQSDATTAYGALAGQACNRDLTGQDLGGLTLTPGTYCFSSSAQLTGTLTLNAEGDPAAVFIFQIGSTLTTASNSSVLVINGGDSCNVYWQVGSSAAIGTGTKFIGSIIALTSITLTTGVSVSGRALARNGAVTLDTNAVSAASCLGGPDAGKPEGGAGGASTSGNGGNAGNAGVGGDSNAAGSGGGGASAAGGSGGGIDSGAPDVCDSSASDSAGAGGSGGSGGGEAAGAGGVADAGVCDDADAAITICHEISVDLQTDCHNCGSCDHNCLPSESCVGAMCTEVAPVVAGPSCEGLAETCGPSSNESCCKSPVVTGGTYDRSNRTAYPATVSDFRLDKYEITVGRFRKFVAAYAQNMIAEGAGKNPNNASDPGWDIAWNSGLPADRAALVSAVKCYPGYQTWTDDAGANETLPMNCIDWDEAFAFCIWDGGRLPTETEWNYAAAGGSEQRFYPWGGTAPGPNTNLAVYGCYYGGLGCTGVGNIAPVGSASAGNGLYGQADLAGNVWEWNLDWADYSYEPVCVNCAQTVETFSDLWPLGNGRVVRGGGFYDGAALLFTGIQNDGGPGRNSFFGARCARSAP